MHCQYCPITLDDFDNNLCMKSPRGGNKERKKEEYWINLCQAKIFQSDPK